MLKAQQWLVAVPLIIFGLIVLSVAFVTPGQTAPIVSDTVSQSTYIVVFKDMPQVALATAENSVASVVTASGGKVLSVYSVIDGMAVCIPDSALGKISGIAGVNYVEKSQPFQLQLDKAVQQLDVTPIWAGTWTNPSVPGCNGDGVLIAVIDSGVDESHPDLAGKVVKQVYFTNFKPGDNSISAGPMDPDGHGTFVASEIVGTGASSASGITLPNGDQVGTLKGVASGARIISARVSYPDGSSSTKEILDGIDWAYNYRLEQEAGQHPGVPMLRIMSISMAGVHGSEVDGQPPAVDLAVKKCHDKGIVMVIGAGNSGPGEGTVKCPGDSPYAITVGSVDRNDQVSFFSSRGPGQGNFKPDVMAPGRYIVGAKPVYSGGADNFAKYYTVMSGTSMATPEVSGVVALMLQYRSDLTPDQVKKVLQETAQKPTGLPSGPDQNYGYGIVDAAEAFRYLRDVQSIVTSQPVATVHFGSLSYTVSENIPSLTGKFIVDWKDRTKGPIQVTCSALSDTAIAGQDFKLDPITWTFSNEAGAATEKTFTVDIINDQAPGIDKHFTLKLTAQDNVQCDSASAKVTIIEVDNALVRFDVASYSVKQGRDQLVVDVICDRTKVAASAWRPVMVSYGSLDGSLQSGANYNLAADQAARTLTFGTTEPALARKSFTVNLIGGWASSRYEYFYLQLSNPVNAKLGSPSRNKVWLVYGDSSIDKIPPVVTSTLSAEEPPTNGWYTTEVRAMLSAEDPGSGNQEVDYSLNDGPWQEYTAPVLISAEGANVIEYTARDYAGNAATPQSETFHLDIQEPVVTCTLDKAVPASGYFDSPVEVTLEASDGGGSGVRSVEYQLNDEGWMTYTEPILVAAPKVNKLSYIATDNVGHDSGIQTLNVEIRGQAPVTTCTLDPASPQANGWYNSNVEVSLSSEGASSIEYNLNGKGWQAYTSPVTVTYNGENLVEYRATSALGIVEDVKNVAFKIDTAAPTTKIGFDPALPASHYYKGDVAISLSAVDILSSVDMVEYSFDGSNWQPYLTPLIKDQEGDYTIYYRSVDTAGNVGIAKTITFGIDKTPPTITSSNLPAPDSGGWNYGPVTVTFTATDTGSKFEMETGTTETIRFEAPPIQGPGEGLTVSWHATDRAGNTATATSMPVKIKVLLTLGTISAPLNPVPLSGGVATVSVSDTFTSGSPLTSVKWGWDDASGYTPGDIPLSGNTISATHTYNKAGIYSINVTVTNEDGQSDYASHEYVVVYDPSGGFVTGGGWINSAAGNYTPDPSLSGKANFGFNCQYKKGATVPSGSTAFRFGPMSFESTSYDWMIVGKNGESYYQGTGTINGVGGYKFILSSIDSSPDRFRMKIWENKVGGAVIYDNQAGATATASATQPTAGGSIVLHKA